VKRALFMAALLLSGTAFAHKPSDAYLQLQNTGDTLSLRLDIALRDLDRELALDANDDGQLSWGEVRQRWPQIEALASAAVSLSADGQPCAMQGPGGPPQLDEHSDGRYAVLTRTLRCPAPVRELTVDYKLFVASDPTHRGIVSFTRGAQTQSAVLTPGSAGHLFSSSAAPLSVGGFVFEGVHHILIGIDHVLFLLSLLLPAVLVRQAGAWRAAPALKPALWDVLRVVTAFTVAHSITLALAVMDVLDPPSRWVESIIAASVLLAALNNIWPVVPPRARWVITFAFGLVHGFGFAGALKDLGLTQGALAGPLFGFNLGVELGQLAIVALFVPLAWWLRGTQFYRRPVLVGGSVLIALLAAVWLVERAFDVTLLGLGS
jgi:hypothetical protein